MLTVVQKPGVQVLHLEDNENDRLLVEEMLRGDGLDCQCVAVETKDDFESELKRNQYDLIISDYTMPTFDGLSGLAVARELAPGTPFIFFSGTIGEDTAIESLKRGATDYIIKQRPHRLITAVRQALRGVAERSQLRQTEQKIREQAEFLNKATDAIIVCDTEHRIIYWNQSASRIYGWDDTDAEGEDLVELLFQNQPLVPVHEMFQAVETRDEWIGELPQRTREGRPISVQCRATLIRDENGLPKSLLLINTDITERKQLEEQFLRSQRLESLGALISGIAHDLNNALAPILIGADLLRKTPGKESILQTIESSARRGADMVQQVLAFTRGADSRKISVQLESLVKEMGKIIGDTFPKNISPEIKIEKGVWPVQGVPTQLYQVLMNLCVNARDAMPDGGSLTIEARNVQLDAATAADYPDAKAGDYVSVSVADTGTGISPDQMGKIFHPFFTTKGPGKGTGLGLSTSINIVKNHGGFMVVHSEVGKGTEFRFHLPATRIGQPGTGANPAPLPIGNGEGVLVIDNEAIVLVIARTALENYGYRVMTATNGMEAITCLNEKRDAANIAIIDLNLPHMSSASTIRALRKINPELRIIAAGESEPNGKPLPARVEGFIKKPFTVEKLLRNIHSVLTSK